VITSPTLQSRFVPQDQRLDDKGDCTNFSGYAETEGVGRPMRAQEESPEIRSLAESR
jgi:hypothetical protein